MRIIILESETLVAQCGAHLIAKQIKQKNNSVLGLATGSSPIKLYQNLIHMYNSGAISFEKVRTFNLDEYLGLDRSHPQSYYRFMNEHLFDHINIDPANTHIPNGTAEDPVGECQAYEANIKALGGVDLQLLGIGENGHIGFNEPTSSLSSRTRVKTLSKSTMDANSRFFSEGEFQPSLSITMGVGSIMEAAQIMLIATGEKKATAIRDTIEGPISALCQASILQMHTNTTIVIDEAASSLLAGKEDYQYIEKQNQKFLAKYQINS